jgi:hypothetical protein
MAGRELGLFVALAGLALVGVGVLIASGAFGWFGRLPGDLRLGGDDVRVYVPLASMLVASIVLTVLLNLLRRLF